MHRLTADDFRRVFSNLVETWDHQFPRSDAPTGCGSRSLGMVGGSQQAVAAPLRAVRPTQED
jgi:hypothetical protein